MTATGPHPAFPHEWPADMHPLGWVFLHPPSDAYGSAGIAFEAAQINTLAKHIFDDLGAKLFLPDPHSYTLTISINLTDDDPRVGEPYEHIIDGADRTAVRVNASELPPGLRVEAGAITGTPTQSGVWLVDITVGPRVHYQRPLNDGPLGTHNRGRWVPWDTPLEEPPAQVDLADATAEQRAMLRARLDELDAAEQEEASR
ncbi:hypothetical protein DW322_00965 [Rhodococcus rhodnii]|uniref:Uncharacterized protein n=2 Tax=Rhodococcus rhodnii TaxID=38312 RepID=R7WPP6_9NOCA|nr:hypothetical protein [Rhodococcus rhodnii]EOM77278.1 hypothetical protein Rrhod_1367 [Rhodococcus rhodnii LMG 5362]TXG89074.1 hypothetical protein DW322_00965 [Rhodococcus rhodnii]